MALGNWWTNAIFYKVKVADFFSSDSLEKGDLEGLLQKLDYFSDIGVNALILDSILEKSQSGVISNFYNIDRDLGNIKVLKRIVGECKRRKIRLLLTINFAYTSKEHPYFKQSVITKKPQLQNKYVWRYGKPAQENEKESLLSKIFTKKPKVVSKIVPNNWKNLKGESAWVYHENKQMFYLARHDKNKPDLNWHSHHFRSDITRIVRHWLSQGIDGLYFENAHSFMYDLSLTDDPQGSTKNSLGKEQNIQAIMFLRDLVGDFPNSIIVGEIKKTEGETTNVANLTSYTKSGFDLVESSLFDQESQTEMFNKIVLQLEKSGGRASILNTSSLDEKTATDRREKLFLIFQMTLFNSFLLSQADEHAKKNRGKFLWYDGFEANDKKTSLTSSQANPKSKFNLFLELVRLRGDNPALGDGWIKAKALDKDLVAFSKQNFVQNILAVFNFSSKRVKITKNLPPKKDQIDLNSFDTGSYVEDETVVLPPESLIILKS